MVGLADGAVAEVGVGDGDEVVGTSVCLTSVSVSE